MTTTSKAPSAEDVVEFFKYAALEMHIPREDGPAEPPVVIDERRLRRIVADRCDVTEATARKYIGEMLDDPDSPIVQVHVWDDGRIGSIAQFSGDGPRWLGHYEAGLASRDNSWCPPYIATSGYALPPQKTSAKHDRVLAGPRLMLRERLVGMIAEAIEGYDERDRDYRDRRRRYLDAVDAEFSGLRRALIDLTTPPGGQPDPQVASFDFMDLHKDEDDRDPEFMLTLTLRTPEAIRRLAAALGVES